jgi:RNA polymerase sigma-70 factor (sigma-E family)
MTRADHDGDFTAYVETQIPSLRRVAFLLCQDWHRADDLTQTALTRLYVHWRRASQAENRDAYLRAILLNVYLAEQRTSWWKRTDPQPESDLDHEEPAGRGAAPDLDALLDLRAAMKDLPPRRRAAVVLRYYCDLTVEQTAELLGCTAGTVKSQTSKALAQLREALGPLSESRPAPASTDAAAAAVSLAVGPDIASAPEFPAAQTSIPKVLRRTR